MQAYPEITVTTSQDKNLYVESCSGSLCGEGSAGEEERIPAFSRLRKKPSGFIVPKVPSIQDFQAETDPTGSCISAVYKNGSLSFSIRDFGLESKRKSSKCSVSKISPESNPSDCIEELRNENRFNHKFSEDSGMGFSVGRKRSASVCMGENISLESEKKNSYNAVWTWNVPEQALTCSTDVPEQALTCSTDVSEESESPSEETAEMPVQVESKHSNIMTSEQFAVRNAILRGEYQMDDVKATEDVPEELRTTVMMRNLPNRYDISSLLALLAEHGYEDRCDFLYIPVDFRSTSNMGYCFLNFVNPEDAQNFKREFQGFGKWKYNSDKKCDVKWSTPYQGLAAHIHRYRSSPVMHESVPDSYKPLLLSGGESVRFPAPLRSVGVPQMRRAELKKGSRRRNYAKEGKKSYNW